MRITLLITFGLFHLAFTQRLPLDTGSGLDPEGSGDVIDSSTTAGPLPTKPGDKTTKSTTTVVLSIDDEDTPDEEGSGNLIKITIPVTVKATTMTAFIKLDTEDGEDDCEGSGPDAVGSGCQPKVAGRIVPDITELITKPIVVTPKSSPLPVSTPLPASTPLLMSTPVPTEPSTAAPTTTTRSSTVKLTTTLPTTVLPTRTTKKDEEPIYIITDPAEGNNVFKYGRTTAKPTRKTDIPGQGDKDGFEGKDDVDKEDIVPPLIGHPGILAAVIGGGVVGLLCAILLVMFIVYRIRKKDEGSYPLDDKPPRLHTYTKAPSKEFFA